MADALLVLTTVADRSDGAALARALVERRLAACVTIGSPVESLYHWRGRIETGIEFPLTIKSRADLYPKIEATILELHPYDVPEIIAIPIEKGHAAYIDWLHDATTAP